MALPANHDPFNVRYSIQKWIGEKFEDLHKQEDGRTNLYQVNYADAFFNADSRDQDTEPVPLQVNMQFLANTAGLKGFALVQLECLSRIGSRGEDEGDEMGLELTLMFRRLQETFLVRAIPLFDFTANLAEILCGNAQPTELATTCIIVMNSAGLRRIPEDMDIIPSEGTSVLRAILTYRFITSFDLASGETFDTGVV